MVHVPNAFCEHMLGKYFASFVTISISTFLMYRLIGITVERECVCVCVCSSACESAWARVCVCVRMCAGTYL